VAEGASADIAVLDLTHHIAGYPQGEQWRSSPIPSKDEMPIPSLRVVSTNDTGARVHEE
jgi:hypothetical protein